MLFFSPSPPAHKVRTSLLVAPKSSDSLSPTRPLLFPQESCALPLIPKRSRRQTGLNPGAGLLVQEGLFQREPKTKNHCVPLFHLWFFGGRYSRTRMGTLMSCVSILFCMLNKGWNIEVPLHSLFPHQEFCCSVAGGVGDGTQELCPCVCAHTESAFSSTHARVRNGTQFQNFKPFRLKDSKQARNPRVGSCCPVEFG